MAKVSTNITLDPELKVAAQALLCEMGMDLSTAVTIFLKQMIRERAIPFTISLAAPNNETREALSEYHMMCENKAAYKRYTSFADVVKDAEKTMSDLVIVPSNQFMKDLKRALKRGVDVKRLDDVVTN